MDFTSFKYSIDTVHSSYDFWTIADSRMTNLEMQAWSIWFFIEKKEAYW